MAARKKKIDWALVWTLTVSSIVIGAIAVAYDQFLEPMLPEKLQFNKRRKKGK